MNLKSKLPFFIQQAKKSEEKEPIWLEYLESDSTAFIDTGVNGNNDNLAINVTFLPQKHYTNGHVYGNFLQSGAYNSVRLMINNQQQFFANLNNTNDNYATIAVNENIIGRKITFYQDYTKCIVDGETKNKSTPAKSTTNDTNIALFNRSVANPITRDLGLKIYSCQLYDNGVLIRDFRPCLHPVTREPAMYDMVEKKYYYNQGTGEFKYEETFIKLDYIESDGNQYIDTGVTIKSNNYRKEITLSNVGAGVGSNSPYAVMGTQFGANRNPYLALNTAGKLAVGYAGQSGGASTLVFDNPTSEKTFILERKPDGFTFTDGDTTYTSSYTGNQDINNLSEWIFALNIPDAGTYSAKVRVYKYRLDVDNILTRDYIPVRMNDGQFGLYDFITGMFYGNAGKSGAFKGYIGDMQVGEYLESDSSAFIDTGVSGGNNNLAFSITFNAEKYTQYGAVFGNYIGNSIQCTRLLITTPEGDWMGAFKVAPVAGQISLYAKLGDKHIVYVDKTGFTVDGNKFNATAQSGDETTAPIALFNRSVSLPVTRDIGLKIYSCQIYDSGAIIANMIPAKLADGRIGMWDFVRGKLFENQGTGEFIFE